MAQKMEKQPMDIRPHIPKRKDKKHLHKKMDTQETRDPYTTNDIH